MHTVSIDFDGKTYSLETGIFAKFANGSVMVRCGDTMVLVAATADNKEDLERDFLPLQVEYREKTASAGKIPGGFLKREGRPSDHEVLCSRLIDRAIRPIIPKTWRYETQVIATVYSADPAVDPDTLAAVGASAALLISDIPFAGPISEVKVGKIDGHLIVNPSFTQLKESDIDITVAGTDQAITMVEGESKEISESEFLSVLEFAHSKIKQLNALQMLLAENFNIEKKSYTKDEPTDEFNQLIEETIKQDMHEYVHSTTTKLERQQLRTALYEKALEAARSRYGEIEEFASKLERYTEEAVAKLEKKSMRRMIVDEGRRLDDRTTTDIRPINCQVGLLPRTHGSALFTRGETQSLTTVTLATKQYEQMIDGLQPTYTNNFFLHYNFPPFCTGEVGRLGTGRREIGHGNLAERALKTFIPSYEEYPYVCRVVSDTLESNGSSSMATVCAASLALFDSGLPIKKAVAGIAMGLIKEDDKVAILSDILGDEDFLGDMDFKVTGTADGITACQMDIKIEGLSIEIMKQALDQARQGRLHILSIMNQTIDAPRPELSTYAPRFEKIQIPIELIGALIGPGGEMIKSIVARSGAQINIEDDGSVIIAASTGAARDEARKLIEAAVRKPEEGEIYTGRIKEIREGLGAIVEFLPKKQGLLHISQIAHERTETISDTLKTGQEIEVKLLEITRDGKFRLSRKALLPKPENWTEPTRDQSRDHSRDYNRDRDQSRDQRSDSRSSSNRSGGPHRRYDR